MNHTGVRSTSSRRAARTRSGLAHHGRVAPIVLRRSSTRAAGAARAALARLVRPCRRSAPGARSRARVALENAGTATWRSRGADGLQLVVPLARPARQPDRLGRASDAVPAPRRAGRDGRARPRRSSPRGRRAATGSASTSSRSTASGSPRSASRLLELEVDVAPRIAERGSRSSSTAARRADDRRARGAGGAARRRRRRSPSRTSSRARARTGLVAPPPRRARRGLGGGRAGARARRRSARAAACRALAAPWAPGGRNPRFDEPLLLPSLARRARAVEHLGLPAYAGTTGCSTAGPSSGFRRDPVVDRAEHERADDERDDGLDDEVDRVAPPAAPRRRRAASGSLDRGRQRVPPVDQVDEPRVRLRARAGRRAGRGSGVRKNRAGARRRRRTRRRGRSRSRAATASDKPGDEEDDHGADRDREPRRRRGCPAGTTARARARSPSSRRRRRAASRRPRAGRAGAGSAPCGSGSRSRAGSAPTICSDEAKNTHGGSPQSRNSQ